LKGPSLFIYWHVLPAQAHAAEAATRAFQAQVHLEGAGVHGALYRRQEDDASRVTLMETYAAESGLSPDLQKTLVANSAQALAHWALKGRHVEVFSPVV
jgi:hypothetical protein